MRSAIIVLYSVIGVAFAQQTGENFGSCTTDELNVESCYDANGFVQCGPNGWVYQECPVGTSCYSLDGGGVICD